MSCACENDGEVFEIKRNDTSPAILFSLDPAVNLVGAAVVFSMRPRGGGATVIDRAAASVHGDASVSSVVRYDWAVGDTADAGSYEAEFEVTYLDGSVETFPNRGFISVQVWEDI